MRVQRCFGLGASGVPLSTSYVAEQVAEEHHVPVVLKTWETREEDAGDPSRTKKNPTQRRSAPGQGGHALP